MKKSDKLKHFIPGGAHTYSRGDDQFSSNTPKILTSGFGCKVYEPSGKGFLDYGMGLRSVGIGYAEAEVNKAAIMGLEFGNNLTRPSVIEADAAELFCDLVKSCDMVKFCKNGSSATTAAVKLARAYTGKNKILRCRQHPFFSYDDWFIGSTVMQKGVTQNVKSDTLLFDYNNLTSIEHAIQSDHNDIACLIMEPLATICPFSSIDKDCCGTAPCAKLKDNRDNFLKSVSDLCKKFDVVFILDETITGFRWNISGAQEDFGVSPDLSIFGKAMANGFSVAALGGKREIMELGSIENENAERVFLLSSTHGAEMAPLNAFIATAKFYMQNNVIKHLWEYGQQFRVIVNDLIDTYGLNKKVGISGPTVSPFLTFFDDEGNYSYELRTLFLQEMVKSDIIMPWISFSYRHDEAALLETKNGLLKTFDVISSLESGQYLTHVDGPVTKPVFRKYN